MSFFNKPTAGEVGEFVLKHVLIGLRKAAGLNAHPPKEKGPSIQCVKLTKDHINIVQMVTYWCNLRTNKLQQMGLAANSTAAINRNDASFLTSLAAAIANQQDPKHPTDTWLFFNGDIENTNFFEMQQCDRGTKNLRRALVITADR